MKLVINKLDSVTGWTGGIPISLNQHPQFIAHNNAASIVLTPNLDLNQTASLTLNQALTGYEYIVLNCQSQYMGVDKLSSPADAAYLIDFGFQKYYLPAPKNFGRCIFKIAGTETITKIEITALHNLRDVLIISNLQAVKEQLPLDIINAITESITPIEYEAGSVSVLAGETTMTITNPRYIDKYTRVRLGTKYYTIESTAGATATINTLYDGGNGFAENFSGIIYMSPPVNGYSQFKETVLPAITVYDDALSQIDVDNREDFRLDTYKYNSPSQDTVDIVVINDNYILSVQIDSESQYQQVLHDLSKAIKNFIAKKTIWVNGVQLEYNSLDIQKVDGEYDKIAYIAAIEYAEEKWQETQKFPLSGTLTLNQTINLL